MSVGTTCTIPPAPSPFKDLQLDWTFLELVAVHQALSSRQIYSQTNCWMFWNVFLNIFNQQLSEIFTFHHFEPCCFGQGSDKMAALSLGRFLSFSKIQRESHVFSVQCSFFSSYCTEGCHFEPFESLSQILCRINAVGHFTPRQVPKQWGISLNFESFWADV